MQDFPESRVQRQLEVEKNLVAAQYQRLEELIRETYQLQVEINLALQRIETLRRKEY